MQYFLYVKWVDTKHRGSRYEKNWRKQKKRIIYKYLQTHWKYNDNNHQKITYCLGTRSNLILLRSWSSCSITIATGYIWSKSKLNWTPAGGSRRKFRLSFKEHITVINWYQKRDITFHKQDQQNNPTSHIILSYHKTVNPSIQMKNHIADLTVNRILTADKASICCWIVSSSLLSTQGGTAASVMEGRKIYLFVCNLEKKSHKNKQTCITQLVHCSFFLN